MQKPLFVIEDSQITPQAAKEFLEQANSQGDCIELNQVIREEAVDALDIRIMTDDTIKHLTPAQLANWKELPIVIVPGPGSRSYRVPTLPDPTGYYYCTLQ